MFDGIKFGIYCGFGFLCFVKGIGGETLATLSMLVTITAPIFGGYLAKRFETQVRPDAPVGYGRAYLYSALLYFYGSCILALAGFVYFKWFDNGNFVNAYIAALNLPDVQQSIQQSGLDTSMQVTAQQGGFNTFEDLMRSLTPAEVAAGLFNSNIFIGLILAIPTALFARTRAKHINKD